MKKEKLIKDIEDFLEDYEQKEELTNEDNINFLSDAIELLCKTSEMLVKS